MKKINLLLTFYLAIFTITQAQIPPQAFNYSAVARNASGQPIASLLVGIQISIIKTTSTGAVQYSENHAVTTDEFGLFNLVIGAGAIQSGSLSAINWSSDKYFLKIGMDISGGTNFQTMGITQLLSVPYAMHANTADSIIYSTQQLPSIEIDSIVPSPYTINNITTYFNITNDGGETILKSGILYGTDPNLTISNSLGYHINSHSLIRNGNDSCQSTLLFGTQYYFRPFAVNIRGTSYGSIHTYTVPPCQDPVFLTKPANNILYNSATLNGEVTSVGNFNSYYGFNYGNTPNPTTNISLPSSLYGNIFNYNISNLTPNTTYYARASFLGCNGLVYGNEISFTTPALQPPVVLTQQVLNITSNDAEITCEITMAGDCAIQQGVCISTNPNPTTNDIVILENGGISGGGFPIYTINTSNNGTLLDPNTTYYVRSYVIYCEGTVYGNELNFTTQP